ncbi:EAL domain-containing protein [Ectopseudomonas hydrolytica]|uniref:EAL domain-containing protein n=1 Tax=Ectopseudomonas hydrolytica TaxID=2493633 RepID=A0ABY5A8M8_9GAMM|nr:MULTISPECIES: EAL domain-containing protein [Pseudomonas]MDH0098067.1 EAL domain-containing protein [Pseudomonas sp. GD04158]USR40252.1 EAL domain-containing protein [Pseudomonas hydrolytica]
MPTAFSHRLPRWSWWLPLPLFHLGTWISLATRLNDGVALCYLPLVLGLVLCLWWGPRVLPALYLNALLSVPLWGLPWQWAPLYALPETAAVALGWWLLRRHSFDPALGSLADLLRFLAFGVLAPAALVALGLQANLWLTGLQLGEHWAQASLAVWLNDAINLLALATPLLVFGSPLLRARGWLPESTAADAQALSISRSWRGWLLAFGIFLALMALVGSLPLLVALPFLGIGMLALALRYAFAGALYGAVLVFAATLPLPLLRGDPGFAMLDLPRSQLQLAVLLLMGAALLVGRALGDLRQALSRSARMQQQLARANLAMEASPLGVTIADARQPDLPLVYCNAAFTQITGYSADETLGRNCRFLVADDHAQLELQPLRSALREGRSGHAVVRNYRKDGRPFWNEVVLAPMRDERGISHFVGLQQDVTERVELAAQVEQQRAQLLRQNHLFSQTEDIANLGGWVFELGDSSMFWSDGCYRIVERDIHLGPPSFEQALHYYDAPSQTLIIETLQAALGGLDEVDVELRLAARLGGRLVRVRGMAERDDDGSLVRVYGVVQDISERKRTESQLRERDERLRLFFEAPLIGMALTTQSFGWEEVNQKLCSILGRSRDELMASSWHQLSHPDDLAGEQARLEEVLLGSSDGFEMDKRFLRADGQVVFTRLSLRAVRGGAGRQTLFLLLVEDTSARREAEARYHTLVEHAPEAILLFSPEGGIVECNENALQLLRYRREDLLGKTIQSISPPRQADGSLSSRVGREHLQRAIAGDTPVFEWTHRDSAGRQLPCEVRLVRMPGEELLIRASVLDISERQRYQREIERLAYSDELTGLPNRRLLLDRLQHAMDRENREGSLGALLFIDLDHFKTVNDSLGHLIGDALLCEVTTRLARELRTEDTLARLGGDEFVVLLEALGSEPQAVAEHAAAVGEKLLRGLQGSCLIEGHELAISASIGIALHPLGLQRAADILKQADTAMYRAKHAGRNALHFFAPEMQAAIDQRLQLQGELRQAIARQQLQLVFQPQLVLADDTVAGAEVLLRWLHPERGEISPDQFIPLAEETGLIQDIGQWVLEQSCATLARWQAQWPQLVLAVNLSPRELRQAGCVARVEDCLRRHGVAAQALELEITEGVLLEDVDRCIGNMQQLKAQGVRFAIDDFGTGYSSLTYLKRLPLDRLKIDRSFVADLDGDASGRMLVQTILMIARNLDLECVAEGIEQPSQLALLREQGCALGQGYLFGKPMVEAEFLAWLQARQG